MGRAGVKTPETHFRFFTWIVSAGIVHTNSISSLGRLYESTTRAFFHVPIVTAGTLHPFLQRIGVAGVRTPLLQSLFLGEAVSVLYVSAHFNTIVFF